jgi:hypothetical protein
VNLEGAPGHDDQLHVDREYHDREQICDRHCDPESQRPTPRASECETTCAPDYRGDPPNSASSRMERDPARADRDRTAMWIYAPNLEIDSGDCRETNHPDCEQQTLENPHSALPLGPSLLSQNQRRNSLVRTLTFVTGVWYIFNSGTLYRESCVSARSQPRCERDRADALLDGYGNLEPAAV